MLITLDLENFKTSKKNNSKKLFSAVSGDLLDAINAGSFLGVTVLSYGLSITII